jgi:hypothetical protein
MMTDAQKVANLLIGETCYLNWYEEGGAEIERIGDILYLYHIPQYGGEGTLHGKYDFNESGIKALVKEANSWT